MEVTPRSATGRSIDPSSPAHRRVLAIAVLAGVVGGSIHLFTDGGLWPATVEGFYWGAASFAAWATARELDHDDPRGAILAAVLAPVAVYAFGRPSLWLVFGLMIAGRVALRSTGLVPSLVDQLVLAALGLLAAGSTGGWAAAMVIAVVLSREGSRSEGRARAGRFTGFGLALLATIRHAAFGDAWVIDGPIELAVWLMAGVVLIALVVMPRIPPTVACDATDMPPSAADQFVARLVVATGAILATVLDADPAVAAPTIAALVGVAAIGRLTPSR